MSEPDHSALPKKVVLAITILVIAIAVPVFYIGIANVPYDSRTTTVIQTSLLLLAVANVMLATSRFAQTMWIVATIFFASTLCLQLSQLV